MKPSPATTSPGIPPWRRPGYMATSVDVGPGMALLAPTRSRNSPSVSHPRPRLDQLEVAGRAEEGGVAEGEDATVGGHEAVALTAAGAVHADDRLVQLQGAGRAVEGGVTEGEDAAVRRHQPVTLAGGRRRHPHDRPC